MRCFGPETQTLIQCLFFTRCTVFHLTGKYIYCFLQQLISICLLSVYREKTARPIDQLTAGLPVRYGMTKEYSICQKLVGSEPESPEEVLLRLDY